MSQIGTQNKDSGHSENGIYRY